MGLHGHLYIVLVAKKEREKKKKKKNPDRKTLCHAYSMAPIRTWGWPQSSCIQHIRFQRYCLRNFSVSIQSNNAVEESNNGEKIHRPPVSELSKEEADNDDPIELGETHSYGSLWQLPQRLYGPEAEAAIEEYKSKIGDKSTPKVPPAPEKWQTPVRSEFPFSAGLSALYSSLSLPSNYPHSTLFEILHAKSAERPYNLEKYSVLGSSLVGFYVSEYALTRWPRLPKTVREGLMWSYTAPPVLAHVTRSFGIQVADCSVEGFDWDKAYSNADIIANSEIEQNNCAERLQGIESLGQKLTWEDMVCADFTKALIGTLYVHGSQEVVKSWINDWILSRFLHPKSLFAFKSPMRELSRLCQREGLTEPALRLISETGRATRFPVYNVGAYVGEEIVGEGVGSSIAEAKFRAAANSLKAWYLWENKNYKECLPSNTITTEQSNGTAQNFKPSYIDPGEIII